MGAEKNGNGNDGTKYVTAVETVIGIKRQGLLFLPDGNLPDIGMEGYPAVCSGKWNRKDTGRHSGKGRTAGAIWAAGLSLQRTGGLKDGFTE